MNLHPKYDELVKMLKDGVCNVVFTKVDGSERVMKCTLHLSYLPQPDVEVVGTLTINPETGIRVWDIDKEGWRTFKPENVISFNGKPINDAPSS